MFGAIWEKQKIKIKNNLIESMTNFLSKSLVDGLNKVKSVKVSVSWNIVGIMDTNGQVFCHLSLFDTLDSSSL